MTNNLKTATGHGNPSLSALTVAVKGAGDLATGIACRLFNANIKKIYFMEAHEPTAIRRKAAFAQAIFGNRIKVEGITACKAHDAGQINSIWEKNCLPVLSDPLWQALDFMPPDVLVDAIIAKKNLGTRITDAPLVLGLGPGFIAGKDAHKVIETRRGHDLGRVIETGSAIENTSLPEPVLGYTRERLVRSVADGPFKAEVTIGDRVKKGDILGTILGCPVRAEINGIVRGLIHEDLVVKTGKKIGDIDPRQEPRYCSSISDKARTLGGAVLEAVLGRFNV